VRGNHASVSGGGLSNEDLGSAYVNQSTISSNTSAGPGGGILNDDGSLLDIVNSTLSGNNSDTDGGGLYTDHGSTSFLSHATVVGNNANNTGGGLASNTAGANILENSFVAGNASSGLANCSGNATYSLGHNLLGTSGAAGGCPVDSTDQTNSLALSAVINPALQVDPATGVRFHAPRGGSPLVDAIPLGQHCQTPSYDQRNIARPRDGNSNGLLGCDIGAVEVVASALYLPLLFR